MIPEINTILYPTDLSETSNHAFSYAASLANRYDGSIVILHVLKDVTHSSEDLVTNVIGEKKWKEVLDRNKMAVVENIRKRLEDFCEQTRSEMSGCPFLVKNIKVEIGNPVDKIVAEAAKDDYDMVIMGARGHGAIAGTVIGSVSRRVVRRCKKPVLLVRLPD
ncbi:MAG: universal stress protein [Deltaproteobacteria bacterium]|jgi:nucleotide-binding universal stress UspA family protein|nr:universal stress protein [Deltaproteobacteria bacterium]MBW2481678.1 universal stress protein [Deltaproteobacteria bacterium]